MTRNLYILDKGTAMNGTPTTQPERRTLWDMVLACSGSAIDRRNQYYFLAWSLLWAIGFVAAAWAQRTDLGFDDRFPWVVAAAPLVLSLPPLLAYLRFLRMTDELLRKIQLDGLALGFGAGLMLALGYPFLERAGAPEIGSSGIVMVMLVFWAAGQVLGLARYR
jgi:hypothetical protein